MPEDALLEHQHRYKKAQALVHVGNWEYNLESKLFWFSDESKMIYGFNLDSNNFSMEQAEKCIPERDRVHQALIDLIAHDKKYDLEFEIIPVDKGSRKIIHSIAEVERDASNNPLKVFGVILDITEQRKAEDVLQESEKKFRSIIENSKAGYFFINKDGIIEDVNVSWIEMYKYNNAKEILGKHFAEVQSIDDLELAKTFVKEIMNNNPDYLSGEFSRKCHDDSIGYHTFSAKPVFDDNEVIGIEGMIIDNTEKKTAEDKLKESEEKYRTFTLNIPGMTYRGGIDWSTEIISNLEEVSGYSIDEWDIQEMNWLNLIHPDDKQAAIKVGTKLSKNPMSMIQEYRIIHKDEKIRWVRDYKTSLFKDDGTFIGIDGIVFDITERKQAEEALKESENRFKSVLENIQLVGIMLDENANIIFANDFFLKLTGWNRDDLLGRNWFNEFIPGNVEKKIRNIFRKTLLEDNIVTNAVNEIFTKSRAKRLINWNNTVNYDLKGKPVSITTIGEDITERKQAKEKLLKSKYYLTKAQEIGSIGTWELDLIKNELIWTEQNYRNFGVPIGTPLTYEIFLECIYPDDIDYVNTEWKAAVDGKPYDIEHRILVNDKIKWLREKAELEFDAKGKPIKAIGFTQDITERKQAEEEKKKRAAELSIAKERIQMLNKIIRHDLSNDLAVINSAVKIFKKSSDMIMINEIQNRIKKSLKAINKYKEQESFIDSNTKLKEYEINDFISSILPDYPNIDIQVEGEGRFYADEAITSVFHNVISNAIIHGKSSKIKINVQSDKEKCLIRIADNGTGIPEEIKTKVFDEGFHHGESGNTGIGLYIVKKTIERFGGTIEVEDNEPNGTVFTFTIRKALSET